MAPTLLIVNAFTLFSPTLPTYQSWVAVCNNIYNHLSFSTIMWLILMTLMTILIASMAYAFYCQLLDPNSFHASHMPSDQVCLAALCSNQPYGGHICSSTI